MRLLGLENDVKNSKRHYFKIVSMNSITNLITTVNLYDNCQTYRTSQEAEFFTNIISFNICFAKN